MEAPWRVWVLAGATILAALITISPQVFKNSENRNQNINRPLTLEEKELYDEAGNLRKAGAYSNALRKLEELISMRRDYVKAYIRSGLIYLENLNQFEDAITKFKMGLALDPVNKYLLYDLGLAYYKLGNFRLAIEYNQKALDCDPDLIIAIYNHGIYHLEYAKKYKESSYYFKAMDYYKDVIARNQDFTSWAMFNLAALYARLANEELDQSTRDAYIDSAVQLLNTFIGREKLQGLQDVTRESYVPYAEDLDSISHDPRFKSMIKIWEDSLRNQ
jgi:tetratricopeptide (TPR) repeat protein